MRSTWKPTRCAACGIAADGEQAKARGRPPQHDFGGASDDQKKDRNVGDLSDRTLSEPVEEEWVLRQAADRRPIGKRQRQGPVNAERSKRDDDNGNFDHLGDQPVDQAAGKPGQQSSRDRGSQRIAAL